MKVSGELQLRSPSPNVITRVPKTELVDASDSPPASIQCKRECLTPPPLSATCQFPATPSICPITKDYPHCSSTFAAFSVEQANSGSPPTPTCSSFGSWSRQLQLQTTFCNAPSSNSSYLTHAAHKPATMTSCMVTLKDDLSSMSDTLSSMAGIIPSKETFNSAIDTFSNGISVDSRVPSIERCHSVMSDVDVILPRRAHICLSPGLSVQGQFAKWLLCK